MPSFFLFCPHVQQPSRLTPQGRLFSLTLSPCPSEKFNLCIFIVVASCKFHLVPLALPHSSLLPCHIHDRIRSSPGEGWPRQFDTDPCTGSRRHTNPSLPDSLLHLSLHIPIAHLF
uniref:Uncharacterized protein n=1 Tax=Knipowitschia caucasica TaxID=637954 RepID=A0AAV2LHX7_KNICA